MANKVTQRYFFVAAACICAVTVLAAGILVQGNETKRTVDRFPEPGYVIGDPVISEEFRGLPLGVGIRATGGRTSYSIGEDGLKVTLDNNASSLYLMKSSMTANSTRMKLDLSSLDASHFLGLSIKFSSAKTSSWYYSAAIMLTPNKITVAPHIWLGEGTIEYESFSFMYDVRARGTVDIAVEVSGGNLNVGVDGFQHSFRTGRAEDRLVFAGATLEANRERWSSPAAVVIKRMDIGNGGSVTYRDRLHKTITPWGHDFSLALQIHADQANPAQLAIMKQLKERYGVRGEFLAWMNTASRDSEYSVNTDPEYAQALYALQSSGWEIGLHAVTSHSSDRAALLPMIEQFESTYGPLRSWVDHGDVQQDIWQQGRVTTSPYFISDRLVEKNVMIWVNDETHSHSQAQDLNLGGVMYRHPDYPGLVLQRSSPYAFLEETNDWQPAFAPATRDDLAARQEIYASNSAVMIWHDYTWRYAYVSDGGKDYAVESHPALGHPYERITGAEMVSLGAKVHPDGTWHLMPLVDDYFAAMSENYNVWYATPREIYDRSILIDRVDLSESETAVSLKSSAAQDVIGLTLFTKERPDYYLKAGGQIIKAIEGAKAWQFIVPKLAAGGSIVFEKVMDAGPVTSAALDLANAGDHGQNTFCLAVRDVPSARPRQ